MNKQGYVYLPLCINGIKRRYFAHRLVAITFIPNPNNKPFINHINGNKQDNRVENLEWCTQQENNIHALKTGLRKYHIFPLKEPIKIEQLSLENESIKIWNSVKEINQILGIDDSSIHKVCKGTRKTAGGYKWRYYEKEE